MKKYLKNFDEKYGIIEIINKLYLMFIILILMYFIYVDINEIFKNGTLTDMYRIIILYLLFIGIFFIIPFILYEKDYISNNNFPIIYLVSGIIKVIAMVVIIFSIFRDNEDLFNSGIIISGLIHLLIFLHIRDEVSKFSLNKWVKEDYIGFGNKIKEGLKDVYCNDIILKNHLKLKDIECKILNKFKIKENLLRERFLVSKKIYLFENVKFIDTIFIIIGLSFTLISPIISVFTATYQGDSTTKIVEFFNLVRSSKISILIFVSIILYIWYSFPNWVMYKDKKRYLKLLDYVIDNYENLYIKHNIKQLCLQDESYNKYYLTTIFIEYSDLLIQQEKLKEVLKFLEENGIQIIFFSNEIERKDIEKSLKKCNLFSYDYTILDKKEIEKIKIENCIKDKECDNEIYQILSEKLGISTNEKFIISTNEEKIKLEFVDFEDKFFSNFKEVLEFLQSKME